MLPKIFQHKIVPSIEASNYFSGLTVIYINHNLNTIRVRHDGNVGNDISHVEKNFNVCFGESSFQQAKEDCSKIIEDGSPDYHYVRYMEFDND
jgi:hypothetical protein